VNELTKKLLDAPFGVIMEQPEDYFKTCARYKSDFEWELFVKDIERYAYTVMDSVGRIETMAKKRAKELAGKRTTYRIVLRRGEKGNICSDLEEVPVENTMDDVKGFLVHRKEYENVAEMKRDEELNETIVPMFVDPKAKPPGRYFAGIPGLRAYVEDDSENYDE